MESLLFNVESVNQYYLDEAQKKLDNKTKPPGSLGRLEECARNVAAIKKTLSPILEKKSVYVFAGDHGVMEEDVSHPWTQEVTRQMVFNFLGGGAGINVLARFVGSSVVVVDMGVNFEFGDALQGLVDRKIGYGTKNIRNEPAMALHEAEKAIAVGIDLSNEAKAQGVDIIGVGDMGIGNTTPSAAIISTITGCSVEEVTGRGTGIDDETYGRKVQVIKDAISLNKPNPKDPLDILCKLGGYEIGGIVGMCLGCASNKIPVVLDGFITTAAALIAYEMDKRVREYMFASHLSCEKGHHIALEHLGLKPLFNLELRLGEGTGAALAMSLIDAGTHILNEMATFKEANIEKAV